MGDTVSAVLATCPAFLIHRSRDSSVADQISDFLPLEFLARAFPKLPVDKGVKGICYPEDEFLREKAIEEEEKDGLLYTGSMKLATAATFKKSLLSFGGRDRFLTRMRRLEDLPLLLQHGQNDRCVDIRGTRHIAKTLGPRSKAKTVEYPGKCHALMTESAATREDYLETSLAFIESIGAEKKVIEIHN